MLCYGPPRGFWQWAQVYRLYRKAFPGAERKPFSIIRRMHKAGRTDIWRFSREGRQAGLVFTVNGENRILLDYLAVEEDQRGSGVGTEILRRMCAHYGDRAIFLEIESTREPGADQAQRLRRKRFYENCGMESMNVFALVFGVKMELMGFGEPLSFRQYRDFYRDTNSPWAAEHIQPLE